MKNLIFNIKFILLGIALITTSLHIMKLSANRWIVGSDGLGYYAHIRSLVIDHDLDYANEFRDFNPFGHSVQNHQKRTKTGYIANKYPIGPALLWAPFFIIAHILTIGVNHFGLNLQVDGYSFLYQFFVGIGTTFYGILGLYYIFRLVSLNFSHRITTYAIGTIFLSSNLIYYFIWEPSMSHVLSMFSVSLFLYLCLKDFERITPTSFALCGLSAGLMIMMRYQNAFFMLVPLAKLISYCFQGGFLWKKLFDSIKAGLAFLTATILAFSPQLVLLKIIYGFTIFQPVLPTTTNFTGTSDYTISSFDFLSPKLFSVLFSPHHGLIYSTPIIFICLIGMVIFSRTNIIQGSILLLCFALQWYINATWHAWTFGVAFGGRAFINCTAIFTLGLACVIEFCSNHRKSTSLALGLGFVVAANLSFMSQFILKIVPLAKPVTWLSILKGNVDLITMCKVKISQILTHSN